MNFFKSTTNDKPLDVKMIRETLLQFIKVQLGRVEGGEGAHIKGLHLFISATGEEKFLYEAAIYFDESQQFKNEVQRIADDYAIALPDDWILEITFTHELPQDSIAIPGLDASLFIRTQKTVLQKSSTAYLYILSGEAEKQSYTLQSVDGEINIGREKKVERTDGFFRINTIVFPGTSRHESNKYISRQHAHIQFDNNSGRFILYADEGGIPPNNKIKVRSVSDSIPVKLYSTEIGHPLKEGDQIMLGESAILRFSYSDENNLASDNKPS